MNSTNEYPVRAVLRQGCEELGLPAEAALELMRWLIIKRLLSPAKAAGLGLSSKLEQLQHWLLLNTESRKTAELYLGELDYSTETASSDEVTKCKQRSIFEACLTTVHIS